MKTYTEAELEVLFDKPEYKKVASAIMEFATLEGSGHVPCVLSAPRLDHLRRFIEAIKPIAVDAE